LVAPDVAVDPNTLTMDRLSRLRAVPLALVVLIGAAPLWAQDTPPSCPAAEVHRFDFMIGNWHGREYTVTSESKDSVFEGLWITRNRKLPFACVLEEHDQIIVKGKVFNATSIIRSFDLASHQWKYSLADYWVELATFDSERTDSGWVFTHDLPGDKPVRLHMQWFATPTGYTEVMRVSNDSGRTWPTSHHVNYTRDSPR
jgi:hypothetical protein